MPYIPSLITHCDFQIVVSKSASHTASYIMIKVNGGKIRKITFVFLGSDILCRGRIPYDVLGSPKSQGTRGTTFAEHKSDLAINGYHFVVPQQVSRNNAPRQDANARALASTLRGADRALGTSSTHARLSSPLHLLRS